MKKSYWYQREFVFDRKTSELKLGSNVKPTGIWGVVILLITILSFNFGVFMTIGIIENSPRWLGIPPIIAGIGLFVYGLMFKTDISKPDIS